MPTIGIDIGGSKIRAVLWDGKRVVRARQLPTPQNKNDFQRRLVALVSSLRRHDVEGIGIGVAGIVKRTVLVFSPNIPYIKNFDFRRVWPSLPVRLDNDARAFARAELLRGAGRGKKRIFALTIGTGIGRAYGRNGAIARLKRFEYPERWEKAYQAIRGKKADASLADFLGEKLSPLIRLFRPDLVVVGGGVLSRRRFVRRTAAAFKSRRLTAKIKRARFRKNGVAVGAALLFSN